ncbi:unnamed protein product [Calicophoron daubneyi]|uniref:BTB domain-containing protein n=1 Tax=Calicophoron daubneyi TaxID=300641 RepID=A0AAV2THP3_CALDB
MSTPGGNNTNRTSGNVSEIAIQADRDKEDGENEPDLSKTLDFDDPFLFSDATLVVQNKKLHCHRAILSIYSPVFKAMFQNRCLENQTNEVIIPGDAYEDIREILVHMYTPGGSDMSLESAKKLLPILHRYQIDYLVSLAERTMAFRLTDSSAPSCLQVADMYGLTRLRQAALDSCARLDAARLAQVFSEVSLSGDLKSEILQKRVELLEKCLLDIQRSFTHSCTRVESRMERVPANHCAEHNRPVTTITLTPPPPATMTPPPGCQAESGPRPPTETQAQRPAEQVDVGRMDVAASILPAAAALGNIDMRPIADAGGGRPVPTPVTTVVTPPTTTAVCPKCVEHLKGHIIELCKRGLHKIPIVMMSDS